MFPDGGGSHDTDDNDRCDGIHHRPRILLFFGVRWLCRPAYEYYFQQISSMILLGLLCFTIAPLYNRLLSTLQPNDDDYDDDDDGE